MNGCFLRIPPFPGSRAQPLAREHATANLIDPIELARALRGAQVGGTFWAAQPQLTRNHRHVLAPDSPAQLATMLKLLPSPSATIFAPRNWAVPQGFIRISYPCDPWWITQQASTIWAGHNQELALVAAVSRRDLRVFGETGSSNADIGAMILARVAGWRYADPFTGQAATAVDSIALLAEWRKLIDRNRSIKAIYGVALWKRATVNPLLWDGQDRVRHSRAVPHAMPRDAHILAWKSRMPARLLAQLEAQLGRVTELEDGMIRSIGLGVHCVPPLSVIVDAHGVFFDPGKPSDLEMILETAEIAPPLLERAARLRDTVVQAAIGKYDAGSAPLIRPAGTRRRLLVVGQVEDDRSVISGGLGCTNRDLLRQARAQDGDAWIIYKPHPDVEAGLRKGQIPDNEILCSADEIAKSAAMSALIDTVDAVHVITSLAGFEALLRGKSVTTHGVPFFAGWGLTTDLAAIPPRRTRRRTLDELVACVLILYPRYCDPVTRLPCAPEVVVARMISGQARMTSPLIALRQWQGWAQRMAHRLFGWA